MINKNNIYGYSVTGIAFLIFWAIFKTYSFSQKIVFNTEYLSRLLKIYLIFTVFAYLFISFLFVFLSVKIVNCNLNIFFCLSYCICVWSSFFLFVNYFAPMDSFFLVQYTVGWEEGNILLSSRERL